VYNNINKATELSTGSNYHLFKFGIRPEWEDEQNKAGGKWVVNITKDRKNELDTMWLHTVCIGLEISHFPFFFRLSCKYIHLIFKHISLFFFSLNF